MGLNKKLSQLMDCPLPAALRSKSKDWLAQNQDNVSKWSNMSSCGLQWGSTIKIQINMLV